MRRSAALAFLAVLLGGCASPPVFPGEPTVEIQVTVAPRHSLVDFMSEGPWEEIRHEEWGFGDKAWCEGQRSGCRGMAAALLWPNPAIVERRVSPVPFAFRTPERPVGTWRFRIPEAAAEAMRQALARELEGPMPDPPGRKEEQLLRLSARRSYHYFSNCYHFTARILGAAGIHISPWTTWTRGSFRRKLDREAGRNKARVEEVPAISK